MHHSEEGSESQGRNTVRIALTGAQKQKLREQTGQEVEAVVLEVDELEERATPSSIGTFF